MLNPCAREQKARTGRFLREKADSVRFVFFIRGPTRAANGQVSWGVLQGYAQGFGRLDAGSRAGFNQLKATNMDLGISLFLISA